MFRILKPNEIILCEFLQLLNISYHDKQHEDYSNRTYVPKNNKKRN